MASAASLPARKRYRRDIWLVIVLKLVALVVVWMLFFSDPIHVIPAQAGIHLYDNSYIER